MLSCKEVSLLLSRSRDQRLTWRERLGVRLHLLYCEGCRRLEKQLRFLHAAVRRFVASAGPAADARLSEDARRRIRDALPRD
ncbi:MAG: zf-HC2 domain-containing protein [Gammaproteobacteria bacterium]|nr:zf-HC2 domain-containing protein [Gammaproteobacteria bacterium]